MELDAYKIGRILIKGGYIKEKGRSSHAYFKKEGCPMIVIPEHRGRDIDRALYFKIKKEAQIPEHLREKLT